MKIDLLAKIKDNLQNNKRLQSTLDFAKQYRYSFQGLGILLSFLLIVYFIIVTLNSIEGLLGWHNNVIISTIAGLSVNLVLIWIILSLIINFKECDFFDYGSLGIYNLLLLMIISAFYFNYGICVGILFTIVTLATTFAVWYKIIGYRKIEKWLENRIRKKF